VSEPLTESDIQYAFNRICSSDLLKGLDTRMGTEDTVRWLKSRMSQYGGSGRSPDGPYSDGTNDEYWALHFEQEKRGFYVKFIHSVRADNSDTVLREGLIRWNNLANRATLAACETRHEAPPDPLLVTASQMRELRKLGWAEEDAIHFARRVRAMEISV
jgi:hypothetical protein